jgi:hypothetical protein
MMTTPRVSADERFRLSGALLLSTYLTIAIAAWF